MSKLLIHIGYHKTATTWFQTHLFDNKPLGMIRTHVRLAVVNPITSPHDYDFDPLMTRATFEPAIQSAQQAGLLPVLSHERLSGEIHIGARDSKTIADRLKATFPEAHIFLVIREQQSMLQSIYGQYIKGSGVWSLADYLSSPIPLKKRFKYANFDLAHFCYDRPIAYYRKLFGEDKVIVLPYESFRQQPAPFVETILQRLDLNVDSSSIATLPFNVQVNPSLSAIGLQFKRGINRCFGLKTPLNTTPLFPFPGNRKRLQKLAFWVDARIPEAHKARANKRMAAVIDQTVGNLFVESNRRTSELLGIDLAKYGYKV